MFFRAMTLTACVWLNACHHFSENSISTVKTDVAKQTDALRHVQLKQAVHAYTQDQPLFDVAFDDLNQDGLDDAIVLLKGLDWCGSGGCTLLVFQGLSNQQFDVVSKTTLVDTPVYSTTYKHHGWKSLLINSRKHGQVMLQFDGQIYPLNPSLLPLQTAKLAPDTSILLFGQTQ